MSTEIDSETDGDGDDRGRPRTVSDLSLMFVVNSLTVPKNQQPVVTTAKVTEFLNSKLPEGESITDRAVRKRLDALRERDGPAPVDRIDIGGNSAWYMTDFGAEAIGIYVTHLSGISLEPGKTDTNPFEWHELLPDGMERHFNSRGDHKSEEYGLKWVLAPHSHYDTDPEWGG